MAKYPGNFQGPDLITAGALLEKFGVFGYMMPNELRFKGDRVYIPRSTDIWRCLPIPGVREFVKVVSQFDYFHITLRGFTVYHWEKQPADEEMIRVREITVRRRRYYSWDDDFTLRTL